jgi:hypothetical protein
VSALKIISNAESVCADMENDKQVIKTLKKNDFIDDGLFETKREIYFIMYLKCEQSTEKKSQRRIKLIPSK